MSTSSAPFLFAESPLCPRHKLPAILGRTLSQPISQYYDLSHQTFREHEVMALYGVRSTSYELPNVPNYGYDLLIESPGRQ